MPQKKNPDAAELVRAQNWPHHRIAPSTLLTVMKGLPLTYSKDMPAEQGSRIRRCRNAGTGACRHDWHGRCDVTVNTAAMKKAAGSGYSTATDLADWLVAGDLRLPFREARHVTGRAVALAAAEKDRPW